MLKNIAKSKECYRNWVAAATPALHVVILLRIIAFFVKYDGA